MPIYYNISPELKIVIWLCRGRVSGADIFKTADMVFCHNRSVSGLISIIDFLSAVEDIQLAELHEMIKRIESAKENGSAPKFIVILSHSTGMQILVDTINLLASMKPFKLYMVCSLDDAISVLGLLETKEEIIRFWQESQSLLALESD